MYQATLCYLAGVTFSYAVRELQPRAGDAAVGGDGGRMGVASRLALSVSLWFALLCVVPQTLFALLLAPQWATNFAVDPVLLKVPVVAVLVVAPVVAAGAGAMSGRVLVEQHREGALRSHMMIIAGLQALYLTAFAKAMLFSGTYEEWHAGAKLESLSGLIGYSILGTERVGYVVAGFLSGVVGLAVGGVVVETAVRRGGIAR